MWDPLCYPSKKPVRYSKNPIYVANTNLQQVIHKPDIRPFLGIVALTQIYLWDSQLLMVAVLSWQHTYATGSCSMRFSETEAYTM